MSSGDWVASGLLVAGTLLALTAAVGMVRFPDVLSRMHAATKPATLGLVLVLAGAAVRLEPNQPVATLVLVAVFQFLTAPVAAHMVGRAAYRSGAVDLDGLVQDDLADVLARERSDEETATD